MLPASAATTVAAATAAMESATAAAAVESATAAKATAGCAAGITASRSTGIAPGCTTGVSAGRAACIASCRSTGNSAAITATVGRPCTARISTATTVCVSATSIATAAIATPAVAVSTATVPAVPATAIPAVPRAYADEHAAVEPLRAVIAVRGAGVGVIGVIAPFTDRRTVIVRCGNDVGADSDSHAYLGICRNCKRHGQEHRKQNQAQTLHKSSSCCPVLLLLDLGGIGVSLRPQHLPGFGFVFPTGY